MELAQWIREMAFTADTIEPAAPLDDLEPLRGLVGDARVVAIGESAHLGREFYLLRHRLLRFLVERCGFTEYAFESPYVESEALDAWVRGGRGDLAELTGAHAMRLTHCREMHDTLAWLREHNATAERPVRFAGTLAGLPGLRRLGGHLRRTDPDAVPLLDRAIAVADRFDDDNVFRAFTRYQELPQSDKDALTAALSRLLARMESMARGAAGGDDAMTWMRAAWLYDHFHRDMTGSGLSIGTTALDAFMAESVIRRLEREPDAKIVFALHNVHIRTTPVEHDGPAGLQPAGYRLRRALGKDYLAIAATGNHGRIICGTPDAEEPGGFRYDERPLPAPRPDSIEAAFDGATAAVTIADLRDADADAFRAFRCEDAFLGAPIFQAFDTVAYLPTLGTVERMPIHDSPARSAQKPAGS